MESVPHVQRLCPRYCHVSNLNCGPLLHVIAPLSLIPSQAVLSCKAMKGQKNNTNMSCFVTTNPTSPHIEEETYEAYQTHLRFAEKNTKVNFTLSTGLTRMTLLQAFSRQPLCDRISCMKAVLIWNSMAAYCVFPVTCLPTWCAILQFALQTSSRFWYWLELVSPPG